MPDISLLPEELRGKEALERKGSLTPPGAGELKMHVPAVELEEEIEILEVDESELEAVLADEPLLTRVTYKISAYLDALRVRLFAPKLEAPPPKLPPQFFTPPKPGLVTKAPPQAAPAAELRPAPTLPPQVGPAGALVVPKPTVELAKLRPAPAVPGKPKARIVPEAEAQRRVRVIKRVRKAVRVSLIPAEELALLQVDVPRRQWTLSVISLVFVSIIIGGYVLLYTRVGEAELRLGEVNRELEGARREIRTRQVEWSAYQDLQPRLLLLNQVLQNHVIVSRLFDFLEMRTLPEVAYRSANLSPGGLLTLDVAASSFQAAARQLVAFEKSPLVKKVEATAFTAEQDGTSGAIKKVVFQALISLDPAPLRGPLLAAPAAVKAATVVTSTTP